VREGEREGGGGTGWRDSVKGRDWEKERKRVRDWERERERSAGGANREQAGGGWREREGGGGRGGKRERTTATFSLSFPRASLQRTLQCVAAYSLSLLPTRMSTRNF